MSGPIQTRLEIIEGELSGDVAASNLTVTGDVEGSSLTLTGGGTYKIAAIDLTATELGGSETNTSFTFPASGAIFLAAWLDVTNAEDAATVDVGTQGTSNDPDGILDGVSVATLGLVGAVTTPALTGKLMTGADPVSVTSSGDLNSCEATLYISYLELS